MSQTIIGTPGVFEQPIRYSWSPVRGWTTQRTFRGTRYDIRALVYAFRNAGWDVDVIEGPTTNSTLICTIGADLDGNITEPTDLWEIQPTLVTKDLLDSDNAAVAAVAAQDGVLAQLADARVNPTKYTNASFTGDALELYKLIAKGVQSVMVFQPILRHTLSVSNRWEVAASLTNIRKIISTTSMSGLENIPGWIYQSMPDEIPAIGHATTLNYGWFKMPPSITVVAYNRTQIVQEWQYGLWSTLLYGPAL